MATIDVTEETFRNTLEDNQIVFVDFWAAWCGPVKNLDTSTLRTNAAERRH